MPWLTAIGLMSGTSYDGVDVALIKTNGEEIGRIGPTLYRPYSEEERGAVAARDGVGRQSGGPRRAARAAGRSRGAGDALPMPRRSRRSWPPTAWRRATSRWSASTARPSCTTRRRHLTVQLGEGHALASRLGIPVVYDFRAADVAAGGQGAPFVPVFHRAMVRLLDQPGPIAVLNIGGVANLTYIDGDAELIACDIGPGNALIDDFMRLRTGNPHDGEGRAAAAGQVDEAAVERILAHPFFAKPPPKSLDRNAFHHWIAQDARLAGKSLEDGAATLTAVTAAAIARAVQLLPRPPASFIVAGGGIRNPVLMGMLAQRLAPARVDHRRCGGLVGGCARGAGLRLSGGAQPQRPAADVPDHHRGAAPDAGRRGGAAVRDQAAGLRSVLRRLSR